MSVLTELSPQAWTLEGRTTRTIISQTRNHGLSGFYQCHPLEGKFNSGRRYFERTPLTYAVGDITYDIYIVDDFRVDKNLFTRATSAIAGDIAERMGRRIMKRFIRTYGTGRKTGGGLFDKRFDLKHKEGYVLRDTGNLMLRARRYPNLVISRRTKETESYKAVKELDGLFDFHMHGQHHMLLMEAKLGRPTFSIRKLVENAYGPLRELFPDTQFHYVLFGTETGLLRKRWRELREDTRMICADLDNEGINPLVFTFPHAREEFDIMAEHVHREFERYPDMREVRGRTYLTDTQILVCDEKGHPLHIFELKNWKEIEAPRLQSVIIPR